MDFKEIRDLEKKQNEFYVELSELCEKTAELNESALLGNYVREIEHLCNKYGVEWKTDIGEEEKIRLKNQIQKMWDFKQCNLSKEIESEISRKKRTMTVKKKKIFSNIFFFFKLKKYITKLQAYVRGFLVRKKYGKSRKIFF